MTPKCRMCLVHIMSVMRRMIYKNNVLGVLEFFFSFDIKIVFPVASVVTTAKPEIMAVWKLLHEDIGEQNVRGEMKYISIFLRGSCVFCLE